jgi:hypothetical protein
MTGTIARRPIPGDLSAKNALNRRMFAVFDEVKVRRIPVLASAPRPAIDTQFGHETTTLFLPLAGDGVIVDMILAVTQIPSSLRAH